ncbi:MAG: endonuclease/exonuclease/phosphatase family protein [Gammaproteobacteria bacterium]|nr:endonuclease/exonuclease/phosphatase family protein [Gammaproteobacteria bacterium]
MEARIQLAQKLMERLRSEKHPFLVVGDFNAPSPGYIRRIFSAELTDAAAAKGRGYGLTFPGATLNPLSLFGPWLRIDYIFASKNWRANLFSRRTAPASATSGGRRPV